MKSFAILLFFLVLSFGGAFMIAQHLEEKPKVVAKIEAKAELPAPFTLENLPFTIVVVGTNNGATLAKTLSSVFSQNYENYRVIYIDDASDDGSYELARDLIYDNGHLGQVTLVKNETRLGGLANMKRAVDTLNEREIVVVLEGEDWLAHEWVLQRLNAYYADPDVWLTYGQYKDFPTYQLGICRPVEGERVRAEPFSSSHLMTFYAGLFKKVREADFLSGGKYLSACPGMAYMMPMLEMAGAHAKFVSEILYIHNRDAGVREDREAVLRSEKFIRALDPYAQLFSLFEGDPCGA